MEYKYVLKRSRRTTISVCISKQGQIVVKAPLGTTEEKVNEFLLSKRDWILNHLQKVQRQNEIAKDKGEFSAAELKEIKKKAKQIIPARVEYYAKLAGISYNKIAIRCQKTRWGSCSATGNLNFNCLLVLMPLEILDSVVVHELCHRLHMNHSKAFYQKVYSIFPDYKRCDKWLKENGLTVLNRVPEN